MAAASSGAADDPRGGWETGGLERAFPNTDAQGSLSARSVLAIALPARLNPSVKTAAPAAAGGTNSSKTLAPLRAAWAGTTGVIHAFHGAAGALHWTTCGPTAPKAL